MPFLPQEFRTPQIILSENKEYELKIEGIQGWGGYTLKYYWKNVKDTEWITKEDAYFLNNFANGDCHGYNKVRWNNNILMFNKYSDYSDISYPEVAYDIKENRDRILAEDEELEEIITKD